MAEIYLRLEATNKNVRRGAKLAPPLTGRVKSQVLFFSFPLHNIYMVGDFENCRPSLKLLRVGWLGEEIEV